MYALKKFKQKTSVCCRHCGHHFSFGDTLCHACGKTLTSRDLRAINEQQWAEELRSLKYYIPLSATFTLILLWTIAVSLNT